jgi:hypothetical protein
VDAYILIEISHMAVRKAVSSSFVRSNPKAMANVILHFFLLLYLMLPQLILAYKIDASCTQMGYYDMIRTAMESAFDMAQAAESRLSADPWADDTEELIRYLFAKDGQRRVRREDMKKTKGVFRDIGLHYRSEVTGDGALSWTNVVSLKAFVRDCIDSGLMSTH